jgi:hypothetical protein
MTSKKSIRYSAIISIAILALLSPLFVRSGLAQTPYYYYVSGTLAPGALRIYGPYSGGIITIQVSLMWAPADAWLFVGISTSYNGTYDGYVVRPSPCTWSFGGLDIYRSYFIAIYNPPELNTRTVSYSGWIICWRLI